MIFPAPSGGIQERKGICVMNEIHARLLDSRSGREVPIGARSCYASWQRDTVKTQIPVLREKPQTKGET